MSPFEMDDNQIKAEVLNRLARRNCWGAKNFPKQTLVNWLGKKVQNNGHRVREVIDELYKNGLLNYHKKKKLVSLNSHRKNEIYGIIDTHLF